MIRSVSARGYRNLQGVFNFVSNMLLKPEVVGVENVPASGPFLMVCNHLGMIDPLLPFIHIRREMVMLSADKWKGHPFVGRLSEAVGVIWVARGEADLEAIKAALAVLRGGTPLGMAPEGTRSPTHALIKAQPGAAYLADRTGVPILPLAVAGTENFAPNLKRLRRTPVRLVIGQPFNLPPNGRAKSALLDEYTDIIMGHIATLLPPPYRGVYADHPLVKELSGTSST